MSFASPAFTRPGYAVMQPQGYVAYDRGDMFIPSGSVPSSVMMAAGLRATPNVSGGTNVRPVPITYVTPKANSRARSAGLVTPKGQVNP